LTYCKTLAVPGSSWIDCFSHSIIAFGLASSKHVTLQNVSISADTNVYAHM